MSASLDALIAKRLEITEAHARKLRKALLSELRSRAEEEGIRLPELGTFRMENGDLAFTPSPSLRRLVNQQYEGLSSERLAKRNEPSEEDQSVPTLLDPPGERSDADASDQGESDAPDDAGAGRRAGARPSSEGPDRSDEAPNYPIIDEEAAQEGTSPSADDDGITPEDPEADLISEPPGETSAESTGRKPTASRKAKSSDRQQSIDSFGIITGILLLVLLGGIGWFVLNQTGVLPYSRQGTSQQARSNEQQTAQTTGADTTSRDTTQQSVGGQNQNTDRFPGVTPGGDGQETDPASSGGRWTIVVASTANRSAAEDVATRYRERLDNTSLSPNIRESTVDGGIRYRVTVGQYSSEEAASKTVASQSSLLPDGAWVLRLR